MENKTMFYEFEGAFGQYVEDEWIEYSSSGGVYNFNDWFEREQEILFMNYTMERLNNDKQ